jgi:hypothetical protein
MSFFWFPLLFTILPLLCLWSVQYPWSYSRLPHRRFLTSRLHFWPGTWLVTESRNLFTIIRIYFHHIECFSLNKLHYTAHWHVLSHIPVAIGGFLLDNWINWTLKNSLLHFTDHSHTQNSVLSHIPRDFPFRRLLRLAGLPWRYSTPPPHGGT